MDLTAPEFWWQRTPTRSARVLSPAGAIYGWLTARRMSRAPRGKADIPVLCVGNLVVGGAGKTPTTLSLVSDLIKLGHKPGILLRGYGGTEKGPLLVKSAHNAGQVGDEALLYANVVPTVVCADRVAGARLLGKTDVDVILMDDGFQNPSLHKDVSLIVVDTQTAWGNGLSCPAGPLRAPVNSQLKTASAIIALGDGARRGEIEDAANRHDLPIYRGEIVPVHISEDMVGRRFIAYSGIGRPDKFFESLTNANLEAVERFSFPDHHAFTEQDAEKILSRCRSLDAMPITTEKDFVRLLSAPEHTFAAELRQVTKVLKIQIEWQNPDSIVEMLGGLMAGSNGMGS
ncbi:tetraacyldisaccharide 4'-kinase [Pararhizobium sp. IMCC21322]|uniref:tetraacyldisaccharide 4'-kinase n=1 Tax=Pararhizobium sp. IMCC21322 TaxID=3067903 RepID=UPI002740FF96|nr:tetraacyldisaccharide 4'-kinase [Pararhizobium sp. IMCC21322]